MISALPQAFDATTYRSENPDLPAMSAAAAETHYVEQGRVAGRIASPLARREALLALLSDGREVLEIGPFCAPLLRGPAVRYLDILDADQLRARARAIGHDPSGCPELIHHVGDLAQVDRRFDAVVSSHAIEHQPDLVRHLREVERVLEPDGAFYLIVPDKRFCFDHFLPATSIAQVLQAWREGRRRHGLNSVIEHMALTTHNDSARHWAGDHGDPARARSARTQAAIDRFEQAGDDYIDVHAWQFTPDSFRALIGELGALGLIGLEIGEVYDTPHSRNEFCAVLRLSETARAAKRASVAGIDVIALQTADPWAYAPMLAITQRNVTEFCRRHGFGYESFVGISRGVHAWQATYNRIPLLQALLDRGYRGWVMYIDADAYVADLDFDLVAYLSNHRDRAAIIATSGVTGERWDVNAGVMLVNLAHPEGRRLVQGWSTKFATVDDDRLRAADQWMGHDNDQDLLHQLLREDPAIADAVHVESMDVINSPRARFIRQHLRARTPNLADRTRAIAEEIAELTPVAGEKAGGQWAARLAHPIAYEPRLTEAPTPAPLPRALVESIVSRWQSRPADTPIPSYQTDFAALLNAGDHDALAAMFAGMGGEALTQGVLGGARQHERAQDPLFARRLALTAYDRLVSLAEAVGALDLENPETGLAGANGAHEPAALFKMIERALNTDLSPPAAIGGYLGIAVGGGRVLHPRMIDAIHAAWRLTALRAEHQLASIAEIGGGAGFVAFYARQFGLTAYSIVAPAALGAIQSAVLGDVSTSTPTLPDAAADILFNQDSMPEMPRDVAIALLDAARTAGTRLFVSINPDGRELPGGVSQTPVRDLVAAAGGWRAAGRHRHWLRAGHVEEAWLAD